MDASPPGTRAATSSRLDGASLDLLTLLLLVGGGLGTLLFTAVYLIEGATRPGYDAWVQPISSLSLGPGGWVQRANFVLFGVTTIGCSAIGWHRALRPGFGAIAYPVLRGVEGAALILLGFFSQDPTGGYPPGAPTPATPSLHGEIHVVLSYVGFVSLLSSLLLARRFAMEPLWRGWVWPTVLFAILPIAFITAFGATYGHAPAGVFERLASSAGLPFGLVILARLVIQAWLGSGRRAPDGVRS
ncbi:MAG TPA: DUF998 domain-containing protein [Candidatus Dormibacteraeota bacterium]|nr:DUF998 domain-containing protein [Candidatus Dormibacteraeota bacterium]